MSGLRKSMRLLLGRRPPALQVGALCLDPATHKVLLITSRGTGRWVIPKGWPMEGRTLSGAAAREAWEEAGVGGSIGREEIGRYGYDKDQNGGFAIPIEVRVFPLQVERVADDYPEAAERKRHWFPPDKAAGLVAEPGLQHILRALPPARG
ncbi:NUDIX hydrolase [Paracoccus sp. (in: a-proteobacteria)]|uniref:NUDIX hydrolase n=1 Tax=Paracoccus sp. TaxID=267 RepID=UPI003A8A76E7